MEELHFILKDNIVSFIDSNKLNKAVKGDVIITVDRNKASGLDKYNSISKFNEQLTEWLINGHKKPIYVVSKNKVF